MPGWVRAFSEALLTPADSLSLASRNGTKIRKGEPLNMTALSKECSTPRASVRPRTLYQKIVDAHTVKKIDAGTVLLYCDVYSLAKCASQ